MINEALTKEENKALFRELVKKYHPDMAGGSKEITQKLIDSRVSDAAFESFVRELTGKKIEKTQYKNYVPENISRIKQWLVEPGFMTLLNKYQALCKVEQSKEEKYKDHSIIITVIAVQKERTRLEEAHHFKNEFGSKYNTKDKDYLYDHLEQILEYWYTHSKK